jgi:hypothetical protein
MMSLRILYKSDATSRESEVMTADGNDVTGDNVIFADFQADRAHHLH